MTRHASIDGLSEPRPSGSGSSGCQVRVSFHSLTVAARFSQTRQITCAGVVASGLRTGRATVASGPRSGRRTPQTHRRAFSLLELMIGIIILGFGLIMVATMFPVAWTRARTLSEYTIERAITENAHTTVRSLVRVSSGSRNVSSFEGDPLCDNPNANAISACSGVRSDDRVHALNLENIRITNRGFADEDPWKLGDSSGLLDDMGDRTTGQLIGLDVIEQSFFRKRISFHERLFPPMSRRPDVNPLTGVFNPATPQSDRWDNELDTRRFCWAVFHRLRTPVVDDRNANGHVCIEDDVPAVARKLADARSFDMYYVTLRRAQATFRYARQDPRITPNPCLLASAPAAPPAAMGPNEDVMFPVPWRVQVEFPNTLALKGNESGIPTEISIPPNGANYSVADTAMLIQMFQRRTRFIDEINGEVYEVIERRVNAAADIAILTLDREVVVQDLDVPLDATNPDSRCLTCQPGIQDLEELLRTVWVFPPPVEPRPDAAAPVLFSGSPPAVAIDVRTLSVGPR